MRYCRQGFQCETLLETPDRLRLIALLRIHEAEGLLHDRFLVLAEALSLKLPEPSQCLVEFVLAHPIMNRPQPSVDVLGHGCVDFGPPMDSAIVVEFLLRQAQHWDNQQQDASAESHHSLILKSMRCVARRATGLPSTMRGLNFHL